MRIPFQRGIDSAAEAIKSTTVTEVEATGEAIRDQVTDTQITARGAIAVAVERVDRTCTVIEVCAVAVVLLVAIAVVLDVRA